MLLLHHPVFQLSSRDCFNAQSDESVIDRMKNFLRTEMYLCKKMLSTKLNFCTAGLAYCWKLYELTLKPNTVQ